jgi:hypothetical protein
MIIFKRTTNLGFKKKRHTDAGRYFFRATELFFGSLTISAFSKLVTNLYFKSVEFRRLFIGRL